MFVITKKINIMNKTELIDAMANNAGISKVMARKALDGFIKSVSQALKKSSRP